MPDDVESKLLRLTAQIVAAHISKNRVPSEALPALIAKVYRSFENPGAAKPIEAEVQTPAVPVKKSVFPDFIICLEDGRKLKTLKRHLRASYNMTPDAYRAKWNLPPDYPMVAPTYASRRSDLAKTIGLGRKRHAAIPAAEPPVSKLPARRAKGSRG